MLLIKEKQLVVEKAKNNVDRLELKLDLALEFLKQVSLQELSNDLKGKIDFQLEKINTN